MSTIADVLKDSKKVDEMSKLIFSAIDFQNDGFLDFYELKHLIKDMSDQLSLPCPTDKEIKYAFDVMDTSKNGAISKNEFKAVIKQILELMSDR